MKEISDIIERELPKRDENGNLIHLEERKIIFDKLFEKDGEVDKALYALQEELSKADLSSYSKYQKDKFFDYKNEIDEVLVKAADYLLFTPENRGVKSKVFSERSWNRRASKDDCYGMEHEKIISDYIHKNDVTITDYEFIDDNMELRKKLPKDLDYNVAKLLTQHCSQREIAEKLNVSRDKVRTSINHIKNIYKNNCKSPNT